MQRNARREQLDAAAPQPGCSIRAQPRIDEQRTVEAHVFSERGGEVLRAVPDHHQLCTACADLGEVVSQLRDLLAAEPSAEVADEDQPDRSRRP